MAEVVLAAQARHSTGSGESRRLRAAGKVPAVLYGHGIEPLSLTVDGRELRGALNREAGVNALLSLQVDSARHLAMARQLQRHPVRGTVMHVDFVIVRRDEIVEVEVPVHLVGEATEVNRADGVIEQQLFSVVINAKPGDIPNNLEVDISRLNVGDMVRVGDLKLPPGVSTEVDPEEPIVVATASTLAAEVEAEEAEAAAEAAEAEGVAAGTEGAEAAAEGAGDTAQPEG